MMMNSQFDGSAAFAGGGFMPSQTTQSANPSFSSSSTSKNLDSQPLLPLTVKQISEALQSSDDNTNFLINGVDVNNVTLVGLVFNKTERVTDVAFVIDDGTGHINCIKWNSEAEDNKEMEAILNGMYVRVHGHLKGFQGKKQLVVFSIRPIEDYNEIPYHFVECMYVHNYYTKFRYLGAVRSGLDYLPQPQCLAVEKGVHINEIALRLNRPVEKVIYFKLLENEGLVYTAVDEYHYKSIGNA